jgi:hypothetical protein
MVASRQEAHSSELYPPGQIITRLTCTRSRAVISAMCVSAQCPPNHEGDSFAL